MVCHCIFCSASECWENWKLCKHNFHRGAQFHPRSRQRHTSRVYYSAKFIVIGEAHQRSLSKFFSYIFFPPYCRFFFQFSFLTFLLNVNISGFDRTLSCFNNSASTTSYLIANISSLLLYISSVPIVYFAFSVLSNHVVTFPSRTRRFLLATFLYPSYPPLMQVRLQNFIGSSISRQQ